MAIVSELSDVQKTDSANMLCSELSDALKTDSSVILKVDSSLDILFTFPLLDYFSLTLTLYDDISLYINNTQLEL